MIKIKKALDFLRDPGTLVEGDRALEFVRNVKEYVKNNYRVTKKQMRALNKVYKRCSEDVFKDE